MTETFYDVLEVDEDATQEEITAAYREKVKEYHPDVSDEPDAADVFKKVVRAEEVLSDEGERARYDDLGHSRYVAQEGDGDAGGGGGGRSRRRDRDPSSWTASDARERAREAGFGESSGGGDSEGRRKQRQRRKRAERQASGGTAGAGASMGFGKAAGRQASAGWTGEDGGDRWSADSYASGGTGASADSTYSVHDWEEEVPEPNTVTVDITQENAVVAIVMFLLYPVFVWATLEPAFPLFLNLIVGICTLLAIGYFLTLPRVGIAIFGTWSVLAPLGVLLLTNWGFAVGFVAVLACWIPFAYSVVVAYFTWPQ